MGLSASQARLLFLTSRMSDLELRAQVISNAKIRLADESTNASREYSRALDKKKYQVMSGINNEGLTFKDANALNLTNYDETLGGSNKQRFIKDMSGKVLVSDKIAQAYNAANGDVGAFLTSLLGSKLQGFDGAQSNAGIVKNSNFYPGSTGANNIDMNQLRTYLANISAGLAATMSTPSLKNETKQDIGNAKAAIDNLMESIDRTIIGGSTPSTSYIQGVLQAIFTGVVPDNLPNAANLKALTQTGNLDNIFRAFKAETGKEYVSDEAKYYANVFKEIQSSGGYTTTTEENMKSPDWLEASVRVGTLFLYVEENQPDGNKKFTNVSWSSGDNSIQEVDDEKYAAKAEAKYEATVADIQSKDKRFDLQLKQIDTEHQATQATIDSVKKVIEKNIERSFKVFQA